MGDTNQLVNTGMGMDSGEEILAVYNRKSSGIRRLTKSYRSTAEIMALAGSVSKLNEDLLDGCTALKTALDTMPEGLSAEEEMRYCHDTLFAAMTRVRETIDHMETLVASDYWPVPTYSELLFSV